METLLPVLAVNTLSYFRNFITPAARLLTFQFVHQPHSKVFCPAGRRNDAVGNGFTQFCRRCSRFLRSREVFFQSRGAPDRHGAADPDQLTGPRVEHFLILKSRIFFLICIGISSKRDGRSAVGANGAGRGCALYLYPTIFPLSSIFPPCGGLRFLCFSELPLCMESSTLPSPAHQLIYAVVFGRSGCGNSPKYYTYREVRLPQQ